MNPWRGEPLWALATARLVCKGSSGLAWWEQAQDKTGAKASGMHAWV